MVLADRYDPETNLGRMIRQFVEPFERAVQVIDRYHKPPTFLSVGSHKIFRDDIYGKMRFPFISDHKIYKRLKLYDFPQKNLKTNLTNRLMMTLCELPGFRREVYKKRMKTEMIAPLKRIVSKTEAGSVTRRSSSKIY